MKEAGEKIAMLTAYDWPTAILVDRVGIEIILVGDSVGNTVLGYKDTLSVTMEEMIHHTKAVARGVKRAFLVGDMPFMSFNVSKEQAIENAGRLIKEGGAEAVKIEGGEEVAQTVEAVVRSGIAVMGHIGLTPQRAALLGGMRVQGRDEEKARKLLEDAKVLEEAGAFSLILECIPWQLAELITNSVNIPTIGIGAGPYCDGQVLVIHDVLGLSFGFRPKFAKKYADLPKIIEESVKAFKNEVKEGHFPTLQHSFSMNEEVFKNFKDIKLP
jgi:3-methyl-2-oxobutanoate hydroxymethyltransferase